MLKKEAKQVTGGLSAPSKMPGPAFNLPASQCITGSKLVKVRGSTCSGCYALKGRYRFKNVQAALNRRLEKLHDPRWIEAMVALIKDQPWFRWHDSGDIQSLKHLENIFEVCRRTPETRHWLPTREYKLLNLMDPGIIPKNLLIRVSASKVNHRAPGWWPWTSTVSTQSKTCPAPDQGGKCKSCRACWSRDVQNVVYAKH